MTDIKHNIIGILFIGFIAWFVFKDMPAALEFYSRSDEYEEITEMPLSGDAWYSSTREGYVIMDKGCKAKTLLSKLQEDKYAGGD